MVNFINVILKSSDLGRESVLPNITSPNAVPHYSWDESVEESEGKKFGKGIIASILPYKMQAGYDRKENDTEYIAAILENEKYKAVFLPELGGRLWSLFDKGLNKELLYCNDSIKVANLALCNGWFAGGVEWNLGIRGHSPYTLRPMFAQKVTAKDGEEYLRMYEYEEIRGLCYSVEARLTDIGLAVNITVDNVKDTETFMYWWSNIAAPQTKDTRIYVPTNKTYVTGYYEGGYNISKIDVPIANGIDISDPNHSKCAADYFYDIPKENPKWIAAVEGDGVGLLHYTDDLLLGRKTFLWGQTAGGKHWNEWLTSGRDYLEIQAGLCKTQFEHFEIPAGAHLQWTELYTGIFLKETEYQNRVEEVNRNLPDLNKLNGIFEENSAEYPVVLGSSRGYVSEKLLDKKFGKKYYFPKESLSEKDAYYLNALGLGKFDFSQNTPFVYDKKWVDIILKKEKLCYFDYYILALIYYAHNDFNKSKHYFELSLMEEKTWYILSAYAVFNSVVLNEHNKACDLIVEAANISPNNREILTALGEIVIRANSPDLFIKRFNNATKELKSIGRLKMYMGQCLVMKGETEKAKDYINAELVVPDIREGEYAISNIWIMLYRKELAKKYGKKEIEISDTEVLNAYPLPKTIDFRMH